MALRAVGRAVTSSLHSVALRPLLANGKLFRSTAAAVDSAANVQQQAVSGVTFSAPSAESASATKLESATQVPLDFGDPRQAFAAKTTGELLRQLVVLRLCQLRPLVDNADTLLDLSNKVLGQRLTSAVIRHTFFKHFVAGEDGKRIQPTLAKLKAAGIGSILDYAAEDDVKAEKPTASRVEPQDTVVARTYEYEDEASCDRHMATFEYSITSAATQQGTGFAAVKMTALGKPQLLERVSGSLNAIKGLFAQFDRDGDSTISKEEFIRVYDELFRRESDDHVERLFKHLDYELRGRVNYENWSKQIHVEDAPLIAARCKEHGPFASTVLSAYELQLVENMMGRVDKLSALAAQEKVRLMIDAEHTYFQPAIDNAAIEMQRKYNREVPVVFNTYQCYLKDSAERLQLDMERAQHDGFRFGAKLVRGAYMHLERQRAGEMGYPSPIYDTIEDTHENYNRCVDMVLHGVKSEGAEVMIATHNQASIENAVATMASLGLDPQTSGVYFGQLLGMADHLSYTLGANKYKSMKYVPFGPVELVMPYLIRRAQENADVMGGMSHELTMLQTELLRRLTGGLLRKAKA